MYADFFGLRELPFNNTPDPRFFYSTPDHEEALASLIYAVQQRKGFVLVTGEVGAGKTLISRMMLRHFHGSVEFATINHAVESAADLMEAVCIELQVSVEPNCSNTQLVRRLHDFLLAKFAQNIPVVLVLDEAQNLPLVAFEQLRMIGNLESDDAKLLQICILGQPELRSIIQSPQVRQLRQRIFRSFHIPALDHASTKAYILHRLQVAGAGDAALFTPAAIDCVYGYSRGLPRLINAVCDNSLLSAYSAGKKQVDEVIVAAVLSQMMFADSPVDSRTCADVFAPSSRAYPGAQRSNAGRISGPPLVGSYVEAQEPGLYRGQQGGASRTPPLDAASSSTREPMLTAPAHSADGGAQMGEVAQRMTTIESEVGRLRDLLAVAAPGLNTLADAGRIADSLLKRIQDENHLLVTREDRLVQLSAAIKTVSGELERTMHRMQRTALQNREAEQNARGLHTRLSAEVDRASVVLRRLEGASSLPVGVGLGAHGAPHDAAGEEGVLVHAEAPTNRLPRGAATEMKPLMEGAQAAIAGLRAVNARRLRGTKIRDRAFERARTTPPGQALANQAEDLLSLLHDAATI